MSKESEKKIEFTDNKNDDKTVSEIDKDDSNIINNCYKKRFFFRRQKYNKT